MAISTDDLFLNALADLMTCGDEIKVEAGYPRVQPPGPRPIARDACAIPIRVNLSAMTAADRTQLIGAVDHFSATVDEIFAPRA